jgi:iron complex transport system ATP-binding protein
MLNVPFKCREIVAMGRTPYLGRFRPEQASDKAAINYALNVTQTAEFADRFITELSGGERQRIVIARAIAQETPIILLDEPTSNLDVSHQLEILELIRNLVGKGRCAIASLHDLSLAARFCDRLLLLAEGELAADGRPREVMTSSNLATFFGIQAELKDHEQTGSLMVWPISPLKRSATLN